MQNPGVVALSEYEGEMEAMLPLIQGFWLAHNQYMQSLEEAVEDLRNWSQPGHRLFFICENGACVGFVHLGSRGAGIDWLEDIFVLPEKQGQGIGTQAIHLTEKLVEQYSTSLYIEAAARNERAIRLYRRLGYDCLNTVTVRKDFPSYAYDVIRTEVIYGDRFEIRKDRG